MIDPSNKGENKDVAEVQVSKPFRCLHCSSVLGQTDGMKLIVAKTIVLDRGTRIICFKCGSTRRWRPLAELNK
jgi:hypothetical protein